MLTLTFYSYAAKRAFLKSANLYKGELVSETKGSVTLKPESNAPKWENSPHVYSYVTV